MSGFWKVCSFLCTQYLVAPPFAWITASMRRGMAAISLWCCSGVMEAQAAVIVFRSSALLDLASHLPLDEIRWVWIKRSNTIVIEAAAEVWAGVKSSWKMKSAAPWSCWSSVKCSGRRLRWLWTSEKTQWSNTSRCHGSPHHHSLWKLPTGLEATWIPCLSTLRPDSGTFISKWHTKLTFIWKEDLEPLSNSPVLFLHSPGQMFLVSSLDLRNTFVAHV